MKSDVCNMYSFVTLSAVPMFPLHWVMLKFSCGLLVKSRTVMKLCLVCFRKAFDALGLGFTTEQILLSLHLSGVVVW